MAETAAPTSVPARILLVGGTFDPPHVAHVRLASAAAQWLGCTRVLFIPAAISPFKTSPADRPTPASHRVAMLILAVGDVPGAEVCTIELERARAGGNATLPSYTIDTVRQLRAMYGPAAELHLLIGADQAMEFDRWKNWAEILEHVTPVVLLREPWNEREFERAMREKHGSADAERWLSWVAPLPMIDVSATDVRAALARGDFDAAARALDPAVLDYIRSNRLYCIPVAPSRSASPSPLQ